MATGAITAAVRGVIVDRGRTLGRCAGARQSRFEPREVDEVVRLEAPRAEMVEARRRARRAPRTAI